MYCSCYTQAVLKFLKLNTQAQQREAVTQRRSLSPYRLRYMKFIFLRQDNRIARLAGYNKKSCPKK
ncbi:MAG: hypothetical protein LBJ00_18305 [Planctomycetaceae bacterium]|nr:hypothetical protein [Planctomycetaceae bacterium]